MLRETNALADAERYAINLRTAEKRGEVAKQIGETERKTVKEQTQLLNDIRKFESDLVVANDPKTVVSIGDSFSKKLLDSKIIDQKAYRALQMEINSIDQTIKDAEQAKGALLRSVYKFGGYGGAGTIAAYSAGKIFD
jgi:hypothetical protein